MVDIPVTLVAEEKEPFLGVRTFRRPAAGFREYPVEFKAGGSILPVAPLTRALQEFFDRPLPLPGGPENAHPMTVNRI